MPSPFIIYVDVDETLIRSVGTKRIPMPGTVRHIEELHRGGATLYCWSSGGADYARASAEEVGLAHCFTGFLPKPNVMIDDQEVAEWPRFVPVHPAGLRSMAEYTEQI